MMPLHPIQRSSFSLVQTLGVAVIILDLDGNITHFNRAAEVFSGYRSHEVLGEKAWDFLFPLEDAAVVKQAFDTLKSSGLQTEMDTTWITLDGTRRLLHWSNSPVLDDSGKLRWIVDVFVDMTDIYESRAQLEKTKRELEQERLVRHFLSESSYRMYTSPLVLEKRLELLASLPVPSLSDWSFVALPGMDPGTYLRASYHWDSSKADTLSKLNLATNDARISAFISKVATRRSCHFKNPLSARHSSEWALLKTLGWQVTTCVPISGRHPRIHGALLLGSGTTDRGPLRNNRQIAEEFAKRISPLLDQASLYEDSVRATQLRDEFISVASHELRTPLTSLRMQFELLKNNPDMALITSSKGKQLVSSADQQLMRISKVVLNMLDTVSLSMGKVRLEYEHFDLLDLVTNVVNQLNSVAITKGVQLQITSSMKIMGDWDHFRLEQLISNLIMNAINFGQGKPVHVTLGVSGESAVIEIQDRGPGISETDIEKIFDRFQQGTITHPGGLGLGLYIAQQVAQAHKGVITVKSEIGKGSKFTVSIPIHQESTEFSKASAS